ncbi:interleukin-1 receptor-like 1 [Pelobates cultripes]|uniref:Interleukin-1 receptor-like 1 n=1 Tax=Pelobates cultripes TaxID=61616 RepID=A0AAD1R3M7_PELCU|nr:interleukin-1 receptor-like 1 [Pelobates cultripes]
MVYLTCVTCEVDRNQQCRSVKNYATHCIALFIVFFFLSGAMYFLYFHYQVDAVLLYRKIFAKSRSREDGKTYDAYVIYPTHCQSKHEETEYFVNHILIDVLENKCGYTLYVPGRNNVPGEDIASCAATNIEKSRRLIIILSTEMENIETLYEQRIGLHNALIKNNVKVIIITMGNIIDHTQMQESLRHVVRQKGTIKWDTSNKNLTPNCKFWKLVRYHMP